MDLYLARHGNTFRPQDKVVWTGLTNDLPLVEAGEKQARSLAAAFKEAGVKPAAVFCAELQRTKRFAEIVVDQLELTLIATVDHRLNEIDYGLWTGLTNAEVSDQFDAREQELWNTQSIWPTSAGWGGSEKQTVQAIEEFIKDIQSEFSADEAVLVVSSNGRLRYFLKLVPGEFERRVQADSFKVKTGHLGKLVSSGSAWQVEYWNMNPTDLQGVS